MNIGVKEVLVIDDRYKYNHECLICEHFTGTIDKGTCSAYPNGIPEEIWDMTIMHSSGNVVGDGGIGFKLDPNKL